MTANEQYTLEQAEDDIAILRGQVDRLSEILEQFDVAAGQVPNAPVTGYTQYSSTGQQKYLSDDANAYNTGRLTIPGPTGGQLVNSAGFAAVTGMTCPLAAITYRVSGQIIFSPNQAGASAEFQFAGSGGLTLTGRWFFAEYEVLSPITMGNGAEITALSSAFTTTVIGGGLADRVITFDGVVVVSAGGTITLQAATTVAADTYTIKQNGTYLEVSPIT